MEISSQDAFEILFYENVVRRDRSSNEALELLGGLYSKYGMSKQALRIDRRLARLLPHDPRIRYNFACSLAILGRKREAVLELGQAIALGYDDWDWMKQDPDLELLKGFHLYDALLCDTINK
jgi:Flp pilus assembly protein TadD